MKFLDDYKEQGYALLRIVTGYLFIWHGTQKFLDFPKEWPWGGTWHSERLLAFDDIVSPPRASLPHSRHVLYMTRRGRGQNDETRSGRIDRDSVVSG